ncbi:MAG: cyclodeaminase/cyclohydrolase family protein [Planctomycetota bacterium]|jgi:formiminotetrahydrofolate cyclodeaminase
MLANLTIKAYLEKTASNTAVPGGGSGAALSAAVAASLVEMVAKLTIGKKGFEDVEAQMKKIAKRASESRQKLTEQIDRDSDAYNQVMTAFRLPRETEEQKKMRSEAIQSGLKQAALVPLGVAQDASKVIELARKVVAKGNKNAVTDGVVGVMMARTAAMGALFNVKINLSAIKDSDFVSEVSAQVTQLEEEIMLKEKEILARVKI